jgi:hypothetical protein
MAADRGLAFVPISAGEYLNGRLAGVSRNDRERADFQLVPLANLEKRIGQYITGLQPDD